MDVFRLLVYAIVAVALLWFFFAYLEPFFSPPGNTIEKIEQGLQLAKTNPGKAVSLGTLAFSEKTGLSKSMFSEKGTDSLLECNNPAVCCDKGIPCSGKTVWNDEHIAFNQKQLIPAFVRCKTAFDFFACKVFVGNKPAQIELKSVLLEKNLDLQKQGTQKVTATVENTGSIASLPVAITAQLFKKTDNGQRRAIGTGQETLEAILPGQNQEKQFSFSITENGDYEAVLRIESDNAGYEEKTAEFLAINESGPCRALNQRARTKEFDAQAGECTEKFFCADCLVSVECRSQWQNIFPQKNFEIGDSSFVQTRTPGTLQTCQ